MKNSLNEFLNEWMNGKMNLYSKIKEQLVNKNLNEYKILSLLNELMNYILF